MALFLHQLARRPFLTSSSLAICSMSSKNFKQMLETSLKEEEGSTGYLFFDRSAFSLSKLKSLKPTSYRTTATASLGE